MKFRKFLTTALQIKVNITDTNKTGHMSKYN